MSRHCYYIIIVIFFQKVTSSELLYDFSLTQDDFFLVKKILKTYPDNMFRFDFVNNIFEKAIGLPFPENQIPLSSVTEKFLMLAIKKGANCNPLLMRDGKVSFLFDLLVKYSEPSFIAFEKMFFLSNSGYLNNIKRNYEGFYPIHYAENFRIVTNLCSFEHDLNARDIYGRNIAMLWATALSDLPQRLECILRFYESGGNVLACDKRGKNILHYLIFYGIEVITMRYLDLIFNTGVPFLSDNNGNTLFHCLAKTGIKGCPKHAADYCRLETIVKYLQSKGLSFDQKNFSKKTPYECSIDHSCELNGSKIKLFSSLNILFYLILQEKLTKIAFNNGI